MAAVDYGALVKGILDAQPKVPSYVPPTPQQQAPVPQTPTPQQPTNTLPGTGTGTGTGAGTGGNGGGGNYTGDNYTPTVPQGHPIIPAGIPVASQQFTDSINQYVNSQIASAKSQLASPASAYQALTDAANAPPTQPSVPYANTEQSVPSAFQPVTESAPTVMNPELQSLLQQQQIMQQISQQPLTEEQAWAALMNLNPSLNLGNLGL